jgi:tetratricopeptide (TPR) repeat protein
VGNLQAKVDNLNERIDIELKAANARFEAVVQATDRAFNMLYLFGGLGSLLGAIFIGLSVYRDKQQRKDYRAERAFYEAGLEESEKRQKENHSIGLALGQQQLKLGEDIVSKQIENMGKLGQVITLVKDTFEMRLGEKDKLAKIQEKLEKTEELLTSFVADSKNRYSHVRDLVPSLKEISRMDWPKLSDDQEATANDALDTFKSILDLLIKQTEKENACELARIYEVLGASAYYVKKDVGTAAKYLEEGIRLYEHHDVTPDYKLSQAFCFFYLGLIEKNWCRKDREKGMNLESAKLLLERSNELQHARTDEFLTPVTLAEVLAYTEQDRETAVKQLSKIISRLRELKESGDFNRNQSALLTRALLIRGNIEYVRGQIVEALKWYRQVQEHAPENHYALLSIAHLLPTDDPERRGLFQKGLELLRTSKAFDKKETASKLLALAWAAIAAHELGFENERDSYIQGFNEAEVSARSMSGRKPLLFSPVSKGQVFFEDLKKELMEAVAAKKPRKETPPQAARAA